MDAYLESVVPYNQSLLWNIHNAYFKKKGSQAWLDEEIPYYSTSNYAIAKQHVNFILNYCKQLKKDGHLPKTGTLPILEVACGSGLFAQHFLMALDEVKPTKDTKDIINRIVFYMSDYSRKNIEDAISRSPMKPYLQKQTLIPCILDVTKDSQPFSLKNKALKIKPLIVISNYTCCVTPQLPLQKNKQQWSQLHTHLAIAVNDNDNESVSSSDPKTDQQATPSTQELIEQVLALADKKPLFDILDCNFSWQKTNLEDIVSRQIHAICIQSCTNAFQKATVWYPHSFLDFIIRISKRLHSHGLFIINDYGNLSRNDLKGHLEPNLQFYGNTLNQAVNFSILQNFAQQLQWSNLLTTNEMRSVHTLILSQQQSIKPATQRSFNTCFIQDQAGQDLIDFRSLAQKMCDTKVWDQAVRLFQRCIELAPYDAALYYQIGEACIEAGKFQLSKEYLLQGIEMNHEKKIDFSFQLGRAEALLSNYNEALKWYELSLIEDDHAITYANIAAIYQAQEQYKKAWETFQIALSKDPESEYIQNCITELKEQWWQKQVIDTHEHSDQR